MSTLLNWLGGTMLAISGTSSLATEPLPNPTLDHLSTRPTYLVVYQRGDAWKDDKPLQEQNAMIEHFNYFLELHRKGVLVGGGGFTDESGGAAVFEAADDDAAAAIIASDPAIQSRTFRYRLKRWRPNPWEEISRRRAAQGR